MQNNGANNKPVVQKSGAPKTEWKQWGVVAIVVAVLAVGGYFLVNGTAKAPSESEDETTTLQRAAATGTGAEEHEHDHTYHWSFTPAQGDIHTGAYRYQVSLTVDGVTRDVGTFNGPCNVIGEGGAWTLAPDELTGVVCYFTGTGDKVGVYRESGVHVVKHMSIQKDASVRGASSVVTTF